MVQFTLYSVSGSNKLPPFIPYVYKLLPITKKNKQT